VTVTLVVAAQGCAHSVAGTATRALQSGEAAGRSYGYVDNRCGLLADSSVQETLGADTIVRPYSGAVCQYIVNRGNTILDVTFSWFESGTLDRERQLAAQRGAAITDTVIARHPAFLARRSVTGAACSATASSGTGPDSGVLSWWVQFRGESHGDPCLDSGKLLSATLSAEM